MTLFLSPYFHLSLPLHLQSSCPPPPPHLICSIKKPRRSNNVPSPPQSSSLVGPGYRATSTSWARARPATHPREPLAAPVASQLSGASIQRLAELRGPRPPRSMRASPGRCGASSTRRARSRRRARSPTASSPHGKTVRAGVEIVGVPILGKDPHPSHHKS